MKPGFSAAIVSARSGRRPFGRLRNVVAGNNETMSRKMRPAGAKLRPSLAFASVALATSVMSYLRHGPGCTRMVPAPAATPFPVRSVASTADTPSARAKKLRR